MLRDRDIIILSSIDWGFLWQGHQELASRLVRAGNRVLYVENTGVRAPRPDDAVRVASRIAAWLRSLPAGVREVAPNLYVCSPLVLPPFGGRWRRAANRILLRQVRRAAQGLGMRDPVMWTYLPTDTALDLIDLVRTPRGLAVYMCVADFEQLTPNRARLRAIEPALVRSSDLVFAQGPRLYARCRRWSERVHHVEWAASVDGFSAREPDPAIAALPRPIIGYVGGLHRHLDMELAVRMARARPEWSWVYVGPSAVAVDGLAKLPNVRLLGEVPHSRVAACIQGFDACTVPYRLGPATDAVFPTKAIEYLAMGKPVVATDLPELGEFNSRHGVVTTAAPEPEPFLAAIEHALGATGEEARAARRRAAASRDWGAQLDRMAALIASSTAGSPSDLSGAQKAQMRAD